MLLFDKMCMKIEDWCSWAAQYAPQWLIKTIFALVFIDSLTWAFTL